MKKLLLLLVATCFIFVANAQKATEAVKMNQEKSLYDSENQGAVHPGTINYSDYAKDNREKIYVGRAHSQRSFRREDCKVISYNKDLDLIGISFIMDAETYPSIALSNGSVGIFYSADHGQTWDGPVLLSDFSAEGLRNYYLSGVIYNPSDNVVIENAYGVYQGVPPDDPGLLVWNKQAFGTSTLGGANYFTEYFVNTGTGTSHDYDGYFNQLGLTQIDDFMKCFNIWAEGPWAAFTALKMEDIQGLYNGTGFDWELEHSVIDMPFSISPTDNSAMWCGKWTFADVAADMVWSADGEIGYAWMVGATSENLESGYQPLLYKTTDGGNSWDYIELDFQDSQWQNFFQNGATAPEDWLILPCKNAGIFQDFTIPWFDETVGAVDDKGNLQLFGAVSSHFSDFINNGHYSDSIGFRFNYCGNLFKFTIGDELIDITLVDTLATNGARDLVGTETSDSLYCKTNGWLHRLQLTKDERSEEFFLTWTDSEPGDRVQVNYRPDINGWSYNITTGEHTDPVCFTCGTTFPLEHYWFVQASDYAYYNSVDETFTVPMVSAVSLNDFYTNLSGSADPIDVEYVTGITFDAIDPIHVGVDEFSGLSNIRVSQNLPNPATGITTIEISSKTVAPVTVEVSNLIGQIVHTIDAGIINGNISVNIDVSNLESGLYLYTVIIANERVSKRMIVR
jgi:hypothetical protein